MRAYNTDYIAIVKLIEKYHLNKNAKVIVHGSGGMAKAVVAAFKNSGFEKLKIYARNVKQVNISPHFMATHTLIL